MSKQSKPSKPQWLIDAEKAIAEFSKTKAANMSDTNIKRSVSAINARNKYKEENLEKFKKGIQNAIDASIEWRKKNPEKASKNSSEGGKITMSGPRAHKIQSKGGAVSGPINVNKMHTSNLESGHYDSLHTGETFEKAHETRTKNGGYKKWSDSGNEALKAKNLKIYHDRVAKILPILPNTWFSRKEAEDIYMTSDVRKEIKAPINIIKRILSELEFVEDNGKKLKARRYRKIDSKII